MGGGWGMIKRGSGGWMGNDKEREWGMDGE